MKKILLILSISLPCELFAASSETAQAIKLGQKAFFSYPMTKKFKKDTEKYLFSFLPVSKDKAAIIGGVGFALASGQISTKNFNNLRIGFFGWNMTPELSLNTKTGQTFALISLNKEF
jgi:hypothetical protein